MASLLTTFLAAFILAYVLRPLYKSLVGLGAHKTVSAFLTVLIGFLGVFGLMVLFLSVLQKELPALRQQLPAWLEQIQGTRIACQHIPTTSHGTVVQPQTQSIDIHGHHPNRLVSLLRHPQWAINWHLIIAHCTAL